LLLFFQNFPGGETPPVFNSSEEEAAYWRKKYEISSHSLEKQEEQTKEARKFHLPPFTIFIMLVCSGMFIWTSK
jgi:hypothetical protein